MIIEMVIFVAAVVLFLAVWRLESRWRIVITPFLVLMYYEFIRILPAFVLSRSAILDVARSYYPLYVAALAFLFVVFGFVFGYFYRSTSSARVLATTRDRGLKLKKPDCAEIIGVFVLVSVLVMVGLYFYRGIPLTIHSVMSQASGVGSDEAAMVMRDQRFELTKAHYFGGEYRGQGIIRKVLFWGWTLICCYALVVSLERRTIRTFIVFLFSFFTAWIFVAGDGARVSFLNLFIVLSIVYSIRRPFKLKGLLLLAGTIVAMAIMLSLYTTKGTQLAVHKNGDVVKSVTVMILQRILFGNAVSDIEVIELVETGVWNLRLGAIHLRDIITAIPGVQYGMPLSYELAQTVGRGGASKTFASGTYLSKAYADFGVWGIPLSYFFMGWLVGLVQRWVFRPQNSAWSIAISALIAFAFGSIVRYGFIGVMINLVVIAAIISLQYAFAGLVRGSLNSCRYGSSRTTRFEINTATRLLKMPEYGP